VKFAFIAQQAGEFEVKILCRVLNISQSGYYAWRKRMPSQRAAANAGLLAQICHVHTHSRQTYGSPRVHAALKAQGVVCSRKRVARLMHKAGLRGCERRRKRPVTTQAQPGHPVAVNVLNRNFHATKPNQKWLGDISYIETREGFLYLASVEDVFSRKIVGWAMDERLETDLVERALRMALGQRHPPAGLLHHSDRGSQYTSLAYQGLLAHRGMIVSMSRRGNCYDNAMKESFFATLKVECAHQPFATRAQARTAIFDYIEGWYNRQRLHSALGYLSPEQFERRHTLPFL
jgi:transposase InsO family protein